MTGTEWLAIAAVILSALAILPGTLGILMFTNKIAASAPGARYIYGNSFWVLVCSVVLMGVASAQAIQSSTYSLLFEGSVAVFIGIGVFGFFMHTKLMFRPVRKPVFISLDDAIEKFGPDEEIVGVVDSNGRPFAFVARMARRPHIVYQSDGDDPFIMTHCILAHSSMSYAMENRFSHPDITITAALANNMVFYEKTNQCSVVQIHNQSLQGTLPLRMIPTVATSLGTWQTLYPESKVWVRNIEWRDIFYLRLLARVDIIDPKSPVMIYPLQHPQDKRLPMKSMVNGVKIGEQTRAYPVTLLQEQPVINDELGGASILVLAACNGDYNQIFEREVDGRVLTFKTADSVDQFIDNETGSKWAATGACVAGTLKGQQLRPIPHYNKIFWYVWSDFHPGTEIYASTPAKEEEQVRESAA